MLHRNICASLALIVALVGAPAIAQQKARAASSGSNAASSASAGCGNARRLNVRSGRHADDGLMRMMMGQHGMGSMPIMAAVTGHVEGRLAFLGLS